MVNQNDGVRDLAKKFRAFLDKNMRQSFPAGACQIASETFERILWEHAIKSVLVNCESATFEVEDQSGEFVSHDWLRVGDVFVDLTIDQFGDREEARPIPSGFVFPMDLDWYERNFPEENRREIEGEWRRWAPKSRAVEVYQAFMHHLRSSSAERN